MKLTSPQFTLSIAALCVVAGGAYRLGQQSQPLPAEPSEQIVTISTPPQPIEPVRVVEKAIPRKIDNLWLAHAAEREANIAILTREWAKAEVHLKEAIRLYGDKRPEWIYAKLAEIQYQQNKFRAARNSMQLAFQGKQKGLLNSLIHVVRYGDIAERCGQPELVSEHWEASYRTARAWNSYIDEAAQSAETWNQKKALVIAAAALSSEGPSTHERLVELHLQAVRLDPKCVPAHWRLGSLYGRTPEGLAHYQAVEKYGNDKWKAIAKESVETLEAYLNQQKP
ncbi:MAG: hypothetical protein QM758_12105 [Armatimonas sp.]